MILAAIDIGSNAVRLVIKESEKQAEGSTKFSELNFLRIPLRLGMEVFQGGYIPQEKADMLLDAVRSFALLMKIYKVEHCIACATSAMREARNGQEIRDIIQKETDIDIKILTGKEEAFILYQTSLQETLEPGFPYLFLDVGGGSTEVTLFEKEKILFQDSFKIGAIRRLRKAVPEDEPERLKIALRANTRNLKKLRLVGTGGNINKVYSMNKLKDKKPLRLDVLKESYQRLKECSVQERIRLFNLKKDRADVIVPALETYISVMEWTDIDEMQVPRTGLADGLIRLLFMRKSKE